MLHLIVRQIVRLLALCGAITATIAVQEASVLNAKTFVGTSSPLVPQLNGIFCGGGADGYTAVVKVAKTGKLSGTWITQQMD